jgi:hypothetical protein
MQWQIRTYGLCPVVSGPHLLPLLACPCTAIPGTQKRYQNIGPCEWLGQATFLGEIPVAARACTVVLTFTATTGLCAMHKCQHNHVGLAGMWMSVTPYYT